MRPPLTEQELQRLEKAVREAERGTSAEIVVAVAGDPVGGSCWLPWSGLAALALSVPVIVVRPGLSAPLLLRCSSPSCCSPCS